MTNQEQLEVLRQGVKAWNKWRAENPRVEIDLSGADLYGANLTGINLTGASLKRTFLEKADLAEADLMRANLGQANLIDARLFTANLSGANLRRANLFGADLMGANLSEADMSGATLANAVLANAKVDKAKVSGSWVHAINISDLEGEFEEQRDLVITHRGQPAITVDNIKVAQFINLILNNGDIRDAINSLTSKTALILGRFASPGRKAILAALKNGLREYDLLPIVFEFNRPPGHDVTETIKTLAGLSYFAIADITNAESSPLDVQATVSDYQIPFVPILQEGERPFAALAGLQQKYNWVLDTVSYRSAETLLQALKPAIIDPAIKRHNKLEFNKAIEQRITSAKDFLDKGKMKP
jgi:uncharacterized protein YjbI with pentapeptide repeats